MIDFFQLTPLLGSLLVVVVTVFVITLPLAVNYVQSIKTGLVLFAAITLGIFALILIFIMLIRELSYTP